MWESKTANDRSLVFHRGIVPIAKTHHVHCFKKFSQRKYMFCGSKKLGGKILIKTIFE